MKIDTSGWTEYISDDPRCGKPPPKKELRWIQIIEISSVETKQDEGGPWVWMKKPGSKYTCRTFWKIKTLEGHWDGINE